jgi:hypothetical protein
LQDAKKCEHKKTVKKNLVLKGQGLDIRKGTKLFGLIDLG